MALNYNKLWKMLIDKNMSKSELVKRSKISTNAMARMGKNEDVRLDTLVKICCVLDCKIDDIVQYMHKRLLSVESHLTTKAVMCAILYTEIK